MDKALVLHVAELGLRPTTIYTPQVISVTERRWFKYCSLLQSSCHPLSLLPHFLISIPLSFPDFHPTLNHYSHSLGHPQSPALCHFSFSITSSSQNPSLPTSLLLTPSSLLAMLGEKSRSPAGCSHIQCQTAQMAMVADAVIFS